MKNMVDKLRGSKFLGKIIHTLDYCLQRELKDCESVLDLGCGPSSPLKNVKNIKYSLGVEIFKPYLKESQKQKIHTEYINKEIEEVDFPEDSFDAILMIEVLEHLPKESGSEILKKAEKWAKKKVIISTPNGYFPAESVDSNEHQKHLSGWSFDELAKLGFKGYGLGGLKNFYRESNAGQSLFDEDAIFENIRFKPKKLFYAVNGLAQIITYHFPKKSFEMFAVKEKNVI
jgi:SAM-dependent methyltransferase